MRCSGSSTVAGRISTTCQLATAIGDPAHTYRLEFDLSLATQQVAFAINQMRYEARGCMSATCPLPRGNVYSNPCFTYALCMRLTNQQQHSISRLVHAHLGPGAEVFVFGSRLDADKRGGDVDLLIKTDRRIPLLDKAGLKAALEAQLALPADRVFKQTGVPGSAFQNLAAA